MLPVSPGLALLIRLLIPNVIAPLAIAYSVYTFIELGYVHVVPGVVASNTSRVLILVGSIIGKLISQSLRRSLRRRREMYFFGAQPIPGLKGGKLPGNLDILVRLVPKIKSEYLGEAVGSLRRENGDLFTVDMVGFHAVRVPLPSSP